jgi:hypothetical protein
MRNLRFGNRVKPRNHPDLHFRNLLLVTTLASYCRLNMSTLPESRLSSRLPRARLEGNNPTVLRLANGQNVGASLKVVSLSGGLLSVAQPVLQGSQVKLIFLTGSGAVLGGAEMLRPMTDRLQPFRFVSLNTDDQRRLGTMIGDQTRKALPDPDWVEKLRSASARHNKPRRWRLGVSMVGLFVIGLATVAFLLRFGLHR